MISKNLNLYYLWMLPHTFQPLGQIFKKIFLYIKNIFLCENCEPFLWLHHNLEMAEIMIWTILNLHYLRMLPQKFQLCGLLVTKQFVFKKIVIYMYNLTPPPLNLCKAQSTPDNQDSNKLWSTLPTQSMHINNDF